MQFHPPLISQPFTEQWHSIIQTFASKESCTNAVFSMQTRMWVQKTVFIPLRPTLTWVVHIVIKPTTQLSAPCSDQLSSSQGHAEFCSFKKLESLPFIKLRKLGSCNFKKNVSGKSCWCSTHYKATDVGYGNHLIMPSTDATRKEQPPQ